VRRKVGPDISVWRFRANGDLACATPCILCSRVLRQFDMRVHCSQGGSEWYSGHLDAQAAPAVCPTAGQIRTIIRPQRDNQMRRQRVMTAVPERPIGGGNAAQIDREPQWMVKWRLGADDTGSRRKAAADTSSDHHRHKCHHSHHRRSKGMPR
jgi:hypothetical protein